MPTFSTKAKTLQQNFGTPRPPPPRPPNKPAGNRSGFPDRRHKNSLEAGNEASFPDRRHKNRHKAGNRSGFPDKGQDFETKGNKETTFTRFIRHLDENSIILKRRGQFSSFIRRHSAGIKLKNMTTEPSTLNFSEKERICETNFISSGPYWHICTDGTRMQAVFHTKHELDTAMWMLAKATCKTPEVHLITFEIMDNHIHLIAAGRLEDCIRMFETFQISIKKVVHRSGNIVDWKTSRLHI